MTTNNIDPGYGWRLVDFRKEESTIGVEVRDVAGVWKMCNCGGFMRELPHRVPVEPNSDCPGEDLWELVPEGAEWTDEMQFTYDGFKWEPKHMSFVHFAGKTIARIHAEANEIRAFRRRRIESFRGCLKPEPNILGRFPAPWKCGWRYTEPALWDANGKHISHDDAITFVNALARQRDNYWKALQEVSEFAKRMDHKADKLEKENDGLRRDARAAEDAYKQEYNNAAKLQAELQESESEVKTLMEACADYRATITNLTALRNRVEDSGYVQDAASEALRQEIDEKGDAK